jgi:hypothetical protein
MRSNEDINTIIAQSELQDFPMKVNDKYEIRIDEGIPMLYNNETNDHDNLNIVALYCSPNKSHEPLYEYNDYTKCDKFMPISIDGLEKGLNAFLLTRFAWGLNICVAVFDEDTKTLYHWMSDNYDYPEGIAVRKNGKKIEIYLNVDNRSPKETVYENELLQDKEEYDMSLDWNYSSHWLEYNYLGYFKHLIEYLKISKEQSTFTPYNENCEKIETVAIELFENKQYLEALNLYETLFIINNRLGMKEDLRLVMNKCEFKLMAHPESQEVKEEVIVELLKILETPSRWIFHFGDVQCIEELKKNNNYSEISQDPRIEKYLN